MGKGHSSILLGRKSMSYSNYVFDLDVEISGSNLQSSCVTETYLSTIERCFGQAFHFITSNDSIPLRGAGSVEHVFPYLASYIGIQVFIL